VSKTTGAVASAPFGSAMILPIPWMYITMLGHAGLRKATAVSQPLLSPLHMQAGVTRECCPPSGSRPLTAPPCAVCHDGFVGGGGVHGMLT
jgi:hypothetical protein